MAYFTGPNIVTDGLVYAVDAGSERSYPGTGTTVTDLVGSSNGVLENGVGFDSANGGSWSFDGVDEYITLPFNSSLDVDYLTVQVFIKSTFAIGPNSRHYVFSGLSHRWAIIVDEANTLRWYVNTTAGVSEITWVDSSVSEDVWMDITCTFSGSKSRIYVNGVSVASASHTGTIQTASTYGRLMDYLGNGFETEGLASIFRIYNKALTDAEVLQNFNAQKSRFGL
jgi:hypothetical protein